MKAFFDNMESTEWWNWLMVEPVADRFIVFMFAAAVVWLLAENWYLRRKYDR